MFEMNEWIKWASMTTTMVVMTMMKLVMVTTVRATLTEWRLKGNWTNCRFLGICLTRASSSSWRSPRFRWEVDLDFGCTSVSEIPDRVEVRSGRRWTARTAKGSPHLEGDEPPPLRHRRWFSNLFNRRWTGLAFLTTSAQQKRVSHLSVSWFTQISAHLM